VRRLVALYSNEINDESFARLVQVSLYTRYSRISALSADENGVKEM
jgi:hypothetical protein